MSDEQTDKLEQHEIIHDGRDQSGRPQHTIVVDGRGYHHNRVLSDGQRVYIETRPRD